MFSKVEKIYIYSDEQEPVGRSGYYQDFQKLDELPKGGDVIRYHSFSGFLDLEILDINHRIIEKGSYFDGKVDAYFVSTNIIQENGEKRPFIANFYIIKPEYADKYDENLVRFYDY